MSLAERIDATDDYSPNIKRYHNVLARTVPRSGGAVFVINQDRIFPNASSNRYSYVASEFGAWVPIMIDGDGERAKLAYSKAVHFRAIVSAAFIVIAVSALIVDVITSLPLAAAIYTVAFLIAGVAAISWMERAERERRSFSR